VRGSVFLLLGFFSQAAFSQGVIEATTSGGEKVRLLPGGRWEYADEKKAQVQRQAAQAEKERERASQGGLLGIGRTVEPGEKDYNRGTLNPVRR